MSNHLITALAFGCGAGLLSACSPYAELNNTHDRIERQTQVFGIPTLPTSVGLPVLGTGTYNGAMKLETLQGNTATEKVIGAVQLDARFATSGGSISGTASGFFDQNTEEPIAGELALTNGELDRFSMINSPVHVIPQAFRLDMDGTLETAGGDSVIDAEVYGQVRGDNSEYLTGLVVGNAVQNGATLDAEGTFYAEAD